MTEPLFLPIRDNGTWWEVHESRMLNQSQAIFIFRTCIDSNLAHKCVSVGDQNFYEQRTTSQLPVLFGIEATMPKKPEKSTG